MLPDFPSALNEPLPPILRANLLLWLAGFRSTDSPNITSFIWISSGAPSILNSSQKKPNWYRCSMWSKSRLTLMLFFSMNCFALSHLPFSFSKPCALSNKKEAIRKLTSLVMTMGLMLSSPNTNRFSWDCFSLLNSFVEKLNAIPEGYLMEKGMLKEKFCEKFLLGTENTPIIPPVYWVL